ncbi:hypothetical protein HYS11_00865 [Candidatus Gottesmanbacteria bacterium]|nr:hypothetical protein [Candidatus Gottesmanbacteria bacterium]
MGIDVGDQLKAVFKKDEVVLKPQKQVALDAFVELQKIIKDSGVRKSELQASIDRQRQSPAPDGTGQGKL